MNITWVATTFNSYTQQTLKNFPKLVDSKHYNIVVKLIQKAIDNGWKKKFKVSFRVNGHFTDMTIFLTRDEYVSLFKKRMQTMRIHYQKYLNHVHIGYEKRFLIPAMCSWWVGYQHYKLSIGMEYDGDTLCFLTTNPKKAIPNERRHIKLSVYKLYLSKLIFN